ncbi:MAG TPA: ABC transporter permease [Candidatus Limnocylindrales bacterium]|nr:ABC transporter permease [Candidatus Limnocylindrales bacterium]
MDSLLAGWRVSLRRTRADWPVVAAAWLIILLSATLFAAGPLYSSAASLAGLQRTLADASVPDTTIAVSLYRGPAGVADADQTVRAELDAAIAPLSGPIDRDLQGTASLDLPAGLSTGAGDQATLGSLDGLADHAALVRGDWPVARTSASGAIEVVLVDPAASALGLQVGQALALVGHRFGAPFTVPLRLVGTFAPNSATDPYWYGDAQLTTGIEASGGDRIFGPFLAPAADLLGIQGIDSIRVQWRAFPGFDRLAVDDLAALRGRLDALPGRLQALLGDGTYVGTGLPALLAAAERSLLVSRTEVLLLMLQLAIMAGYAILLTASLLGEHRRVDTALLRSRGAGATQVAWLALVEGLVIATPAVLLAPWLALAALSVLEVVGPLADAGLGINPRVGVDAYAYAAAAGLACVALLVLPAALGARRFAVEQHDVSRQGTRTLGGRIGLDVALLAVTGIALWQLRLYGAPLTRTVHGSLGLDPLLVAAPAVGLLTGGIVALRVLPGLARVGESLLSRARALVGSLGSRELARRPLRYTRSALLVMLALSMGVFGVSYAATWSTSQRDQAAYQAGAPVRVVPDRSAAGLPASALAAAYAALPGVRQLSPVERQTAAVRFGNSSVDLLALDAAVAPDLVLFRPDASAASLVDLMRPLGAARPRPTLPTLPDGATALRIVPRIDLASVVRIAFDPFSGDTTTESLDPATIDVRVAVSAVVRDAHGLLYRVQSAQVPFGPGSVLVVSLAPAGDRLDGPVQLAGLALDIAIPAEVTATGGALGLASASSGPGPDGPWTDLSLASAGGWSAGIGPTGRALVSVPGAATEQPSMELTGNGQAGTLLGGGTRLNFTPSALNALDAPVPVIANRAFLAAAAATAGETLNGTIEGAGSRPLTITGVVESFPTTDPARPLVVLDDPTLALLRLESTGGVRSPDEWWLGANQGASAPLAAALRAAPFGSATVVTADGRTASLRADPVALGIIGALLLGFIATGLFAVVGLTVSAAVSARQRRTEFALLRALGLSARQLSSWLWLENGSLVAVSLVAGTALGLFIGWLVLPFVAVTQQAAAPVPPVIVLVPWDQVVVLDVASALALGVAVVVIGRVLRGLGVGSVLRMGED